MKILMALAICGMLLPLVGCETVAETPAENQVRMGHAVVMDGRQIPDDVESILLLDKPVKMSRYPIPDE